MFGLAPLLPIPWFQDRPVAARLANRAQEPQRDMEGITLLVLPTPGPAAALPAELPDRIERVAESAPETPAPASDGPRWDWSYDPLVPLQGGRPEPVLDGARLPDLRLESLFARSQPRTAMDSLLLGLDHFAFLQSSLALTYRHLWEAEARALWLERHELWLKLYGSDDDWP